MDQELQKAVCWKLATLANLAFIGNCFSDAFPTPLPVSLISLIQSHSFTYALSRAHFLGASPSIIHFVCPSVYTLVGKCPLYEKLSLMFANHQKNILSFFFKSDVSRNFRMKVCKGRIRIKKHLEEKILLRAPSAAGPDDGERQLLDDAIRALATELTSRSARDAD